MNRYYFYKRRKDIREDLKGDLIDLSLSALYSEKAYSQKNGKQILNFKFFDETQLCISTKTPGIFKAESDSGTGGCKGHWAKSLKELKEAFSKDEYVLISEREYFRLRKFAFRLIFQKIKFFPNSDSDTNRNFLYQNSWSNFFYDIRLLATSEKDNIRNYSASTIELYKENNWKLCNFRIDESFKIFISKDKNNKTNKFSIESTHFNSYYESLENLKSSHFLSSGYYPSGKIESIKDFQFERLKNKAIELILDRSDLDISSILPKQTHSVLILD